MGDEAEARCSVRMFMKASQDMGTYPVSVPSGTPVTKVGLKQEY